MSHFQAPNPPLQITAVRRPATRADTKSFQFDEASLAVQSAGADREAFINILVFTPHRLMTHYQDYQRLGA